MNYFKIPYISGKQTKYINLDKAHEVHISPDGFVIDGKVYHSNNVEDIGKVRAELMDRLEGNETKT